MLKKILESLPILNSDKMTNDLVNKISHETKRLLSENRIDIKDDLNKIETRLSEIEIQLANLISKVELEEHKNKQA